MGSDVYQQYLEGLVVTICSTIYSTSNFSTVNAHGHPAVDFVQLYTNVRAVPEYCDLPPWDETPVLE